MFAQGRSTRRVPLRQKRHTENWPVFGTGKGGKLRQRKGNTENKIMGKMLEGEENRTRQKIYR